MAKSFKFCNRFKLVWKLHNDKKTLWEISQRRWRFLQEPGDMKI